MRRPRCDSAQRVVAGMDASSLDVADPRLRPCSQLAKALVDRQVLGNVLTAGEARREALDDLIVKPGLAVIRELLWHPATILESPDNVVAVGGRKRRKGLLLDRHPFLIPARFVVDLGDEDFDLFPALELRDQRRLQRRLTLCQPLLQHTGLLLVEGPAGCRDAVAEPRHVVLKLDGVLRVPVYVEISPQLQRRFDVLYAVVLHLLGPAIPGTVKISFGNTQALAPGSQRVFSGL